jgi:hypothetical protein
MKIERIDTVKCSKCNSTEMTTIGFRVVQGYLCKACNLYHKKNGEIKLTIGIVNRSAGFLFESDLRFCKK